MLNLFVAPIQRAIGWLDAVNDRLTSYRLILYILLALVVWNIFGSFIHQVPYTATNIIFSSAWLMAISWAANKLIARSFNVPVNKESGLITGLILALIMSPSSSLNDFVILAAAAVVAMASKYILAFRRAHIFNPAAFGAFIAGVAFNDYASWWVGTKFSVVIVAIGGLLLLRKMKRFSMVAVFCAIYVLLLIWQMPSGSSTDAVQHLVWLGIIGTELLFFSTIMFTEPLTSPSRLEPTLIYAIIVGVFYSYNRLHVSPEESLLIGNALTFLIAPNRRYKFSFIHRIKEAEGIYSYVFSPPSKFNFKAGQYLEWTLAQNESDSRGNRRYLTISSAPSENEIMFTIKVPPRPSAFKRQLELLKTGDSILASYLSGSFTLPDDPSKKLAFVAGGVGITPFRSMIKFLLDKKQQRDVAVLYSANKAEELAFRDLFSQAKAVGLKSFFTTQAIGKEAISSALPDYAERTFYVSGPYGFVQAIERALNELGISPTQVVTDYFPGYGR